jgi:hypothetical protein
MGKILKLPGLGPCCTARCLSGVWCMEGGGQNACAESVATRIPQAMVQGAEWHVVAEMPPLECCSGWFFA